MVVLFQQYIENICFSFNLSAGGLCDWGILLVISLELAVFNFTVDDFFNENQ